MESSTYCTRGWYFELVRSLNYTVQVKIQTRQTRVYTLQASKTRVFGFGKTRVGNPKLNLLKFAETVNSKN